MRVYLGVIGLVVTMVVLFTFAPIGTNYKLDIASYNNVQNEKLNVGKEIVLKKVTVTASVATTWGDKLVATVKTHLGANYSWGASGPKEFDCSGLIQFTYKELGQSIDRTTYDQVVQGIEVPIKEVMPGDIIFFDNSSRGPEHEAMYIGNGEIIHAPHKNTVVRVEKLINMKPVTSIRRIAQK